MSVFTMMMPRRIMGRTCPLTAPYRLLRVRPTNTVLDPETHDPLPRGIWVGGTQPMAYSDYTLLAAYWSPDEVFWTAQVPMAADADGTGTALNGLAAMSDREVYLAADTGYIWRIDPQAVEPDQHIINGYQLPLESPGRRKAVLAGGSDTGDLVFFYDSQPDLDHLNKARYGHDPAGTDLAYVNITAPALDNYTYDANTEAAIIGGQLFTTLTEFAYETTPSGGFARLYKALPPLDIAGPEGLGWTNERLRLSGVGALNAWALICLEDGTTPGQLYRNAGADPGEWTAVPLPTTAGGYSFYWRGVAAGTTAIAHEDNIWICGVRVGSGDDCDPCVAHRDNLTGDWEITPLLLNYFTHALDGDGLQDIWILAEDDVWAVGSVCSDSETGLSRSLVVHYDGTAWTERNIAA